MTSLKELIQSLKAFFVVIIENEISFENEPERIVGKFVSLPKVNQELLRSDLQAVGFKESAHSLMSFGQAFKALQHSEEKKHLLPDDIRYYLEHHIEGNKDILEALNTLLELLAKSLGSPLRTKLNDTLLKHGIYYTFAPQYLDLLQLLNSIPGVLINYYKRTPTADELDTFCKSLDEGVRMTGGKFSIAIVDKMLEEGSTNPIGREFILDLQNLYKKKNKTNVLGVLFTSAPKDTFPHRYNDYFVREIDKGTKTILVDFTEKLTLCAYALTFRFLRHSYLKSTKRAFNLVLKNQRNIKNILLQGSGEGISPFESLNSWFKLAQGYYLETIIYDNFPYAFGLTKFFEESFLPDHPEEAEISNELREIRSFELFDYNINKKLLPIAAGDIFEFNSDFFVLLGQACDLMLRDDNRRGAKVAELFKVILDPDDKKQSHKFEIKVSNEKTVNIENFKPDNEEEYKLLKLEISSKNMELADWRVLDLCTFNTKGVCLIDLENTPDSTVTDIKLRSRQDYYKQLVAHFSRIKELVAGNDELNNLFDLVTVNSFEFHQQEGKEVLEYGVRRIARIKDRFVDSIYRQLINYKGRIDLNLIDYAREIAERVELRYGFYGEDPLKITELSLWTDRSGVFFKKEELLNVLEEKYREAFFELHSSRIKPSKNKDYEFSIVDQVYSLKVKYILEFDNNPQPHIKPTINYRQLRLDKNKDGTFCYLDTGEKASFWNEDKTAIPINLYDLTRKIKVYQTNQIVFLEGRRIKFIDEEE